MSILCTFPGRYGDLLWALPTIRALARRLRETVDLQIAGEFASIVDLLRAQPYLGKVGADPEWPLHPDHPRPPARPAVEAQYDCIIHLGYRGWPQRPLPFETLDCLNAQYLVGDPIPDAASAALQENGPIMDGELHLEDPWITVSYPTPGVGIAVGFTEAWFELKLGLCCCLAQRVPGWLTQLTPPGSRWTSEVPELGLGFDVQPSSDWINIANTLAGSDLFFGDCSALHVLAVALGKRVVVCEPMEARHNKIFWPLGTTGPQVTLVRGNDGNPTFDARHCADAIELTLKETT